MAQTGFFAYSSNPNELGTVIESAVKIVNDNPSNNIEISYWTALDIFGKFISEQVTNKIEECNFFIADITTLNLNVVYEIGYAIGLSKPILLVKNQALTTRGVKIEQVGIFDTLGYKQYQNSYDLATHLQVANTQKSLNVNYPLNTSAPVFLVNTPHKTDWSNRISSRIKKAAFIFREYDPNETARLSGFDAIKNVSESLGVVIPFLSNISTDFEGHNIKASFIAGLADGMGKVSLLLQNGEDPVPLDYRDFVSVAKFPDDINDYMASFAIQVTSEFQKSRPKQDNSIKSFLKTLELGSTSAENEMRSLENYYLQTDQYLKACRGEAHIVAGRKGAGKTAVFLQIRDQERSRNRSKNIVLDLKPDGYKLIKFKEKMLSFLAEGSYQHVITAFWEYVLLLEICYKILEKDADRHIRDHDLYDGYRELYDLYNTDEYISEGDFSERMSHLTERIYSDYQDKYTGQENTTLNSNQITELLYSHDVKKLREKLKNYLSHKEILWLLFDNVDKGWPTSGLKHEDLLIIRALVDATRKIEQEFTSDNLTINSIVFLRNDVYELLVKETSDRGKEASVSLDWTDPDLLRELVRLRIVSNGLLAQTDFKTAWQRIFISHYKGEESSQYLIERSLMRPRFLLNLISICKGIAINLNHETILEDDIDKGFAAYSTDLISDINYELSDVFNGKDDLLYCFIGSEPQLDTTTVLNLLITEASLTIDQAENALYLLLWYGFLGFKSSVEKVNYIYDYYYNMRLFDATRKKQSSSDMLYINQAFWPGLGITES